MYVLDLHMHLYIVEQEVVKWGVAEIDTSYMVNEQI